MRLTYISKDTSLSLKGFALFLMVFLHLFNQEQNIKDCFSLFSILGVPFANFLAKGCNPVNIFLFVSGYGLYYLQIRRKQKGGHKLRLLKLYITYWLTLLCFISYGSLTRPDTYPGSLTNIFANVTAFCTTYNHEAWFLFPYALLSLTSDLMFKVLDRIGAKISFLIAIPLNYLAMYLISRHSVDYINSHYAIYHIVLYFDCLLPFITGALSCKYADFQFHGKWTILFKKSKLLILLLILLFLSGCIIDSAAFTPIRIPLIILIFIRINWNIHIESFFQFLGRYSSEVWLIHTWICYYLFKDFIYSFHYPILILSVELAISIVLGYIIHKIAKNFFCIILPQTK